MRSFQQGTIRSLNHGRGYGFVQPERETPEHRGGIFFHCSSIEDGDFDALRAGDAVEFTVTQGDRGPRCGTVRPVAAEVSP